MGDYHGGGYQLRVQDGGTEAGSSQSPIRRLVEEEYIVLLALKARDEASAALNSVDGVLQKIKGSIASAQSALGGFSSTVSDIGVVGLAVFGVVAGFFAKIGRAACR